MIHVIQSTLDLLSDPEQTSDMPEFNEAVSAIRSHISNDFYFKYDLSDDEFFQVCAFIVAHLKSVIDDLIRQKIYPQIISNVMFARWLRLIILPTFVPETRYQKMEYYFEKIIVAAQNYVPKLFLS